MEIISYYVLRAKELDLCSNEQGFSYEDKMEFIFSEENHKISLEILESWCKT